jgi:hypothetical protein
VTVRSILAAAGVTATLLVSVAACGSSSATSTPAAPASAEAPASAAASAAASSEPSVSIPSAAASEPGSDGSAPDAASLLTADMAASIIGGSPEKITPPFNIPNMSVASYSNANGDSVTLFIEVIPGGVGNLQMQTAIAMAGAQGDLQPITGIGDLAGKVVNDQDATVAFVKGSALVVVEATSGTMAGSDLEPKVEDIARQIAPGL